MAGPDGFPTLGHLAEAWVRQHCRVPDKMRRGDPFVWSDWQFWISAKYFEIRAHAELPSTGDLLLNQAFRYRRAQIIAPQKTGKGPHGASMTCLHAVGPSEFGGWAGKGDGYACLDHGCGCGWEYPYLEGEPMGVRHPSPVIQLTAVNQDQVGNVWKPLTAMIRLGPLSDLLFPHDNWIRISGDVGGEDFDRIDAVTSSASGRVGNPVSWVLQDESGLYLKSNKMVSVAQTQRRNAAGMGGRSIEYTNCFDTSQNSTAQQTFDSVREDIFKFYRKPPAHLSWKNKLERRKILQYVYEGSPWVILDSIEADAAELNETDPDQAERFFGNRNTYGSGVWLRDGLWDEHYAQTATLAS
ncbi:terminase [Rhodococcus sp. 05-2255-3B1]|uniref:terminase n=1 Tax=unclassified Rhodococcus (in: high G+C Gram-positive bacteria) TaxID=192944 RepID=UPI000B9B6137|nr:MULTISPECIES: terminase [unclassified Rhodococcus (in: high G+C Gram-positive bacteria)]OZE13368.1 terminase [Rhodococcus sp. 05-2255-3C]OZE16020.1 terminase [Rhodococcus sp. 05-2255-3B1]OZE19060.1 terminase [Rhodococcus sp. 05-2255-2A2]